MRKGILIFVLCLAGCGGSHSAPVAPDPPPEITTQPANQSVQAGQTALFSVVATGTPPLTYQWQENDSNIQGATNATYSIPSTTTANSGEVFQVIVTNSAGTVTSNPATLTVTASPPPPPPVTVSSISVTPSSASLTPTQTQQFVGVVTYSDGSTDQNVTWSAIGAGTINSAGVFTPTALGSASVIGAATEDTSVLMTVPVTVSSVVSGKYAGTLTPSVADASQGSYYWSFNLDQNTNGSLTSEIGVNAVASSAPDLLSASDLASPEATISGSQNNTAVSMTATSGQNVASLTGIENFDGSISGSFTSSGGPSLAAQAGTFSFTQFGLLNGTWVSTIVVGSQNIPVTLVLNEVAPTSTTPRQFTGTMTVGGETIPFSSDGGIVEGDLFQITGDSQQLTPCYIIGQMMDVQGNSLAAQIGSPDFGGYGNCPVPLSQTEYVVFVKQ